MTKHFKDDGDYVAEGDPLEQTPINEGLRIVLADRDFWEAWGKTLGLELHGFSGQDSASFSSHGEYIRVLKFSSDRERSNFKFLNALRERLLYRSRRGDDR